jgi:Zn-finger nucleic acid-binding protein
MADTYYCPDCKIAMELVVPDDNENYYKCPKCRMEIAEEDVKNED